MRFRQDHSIYKSGDNGDEGDGREILIDPVVGAAAASLVLVVRTGAPAEPPISIAPAVVVTNPVRFIEATLADLSCYVAARNRGAANWAENLIDEKFEQLRRCGIEAEIKEIQ